MISLHQNKRPVPFDWVDCKDGKNVAIKIKIKDFSIYRSLILQIDAIDLDLSKAFDKYRLDHNRLNDEEYVTELLVNAASRKLSNEQLFFMAFNALSIMPESNHFFGALITLLSYKYLEVPDSREWIVDILVEAKKRFEDAADVCSPSTVRWGISSSAALTLLLLLKDRIPDAEGVVDTTLFKWDPNLNHLSYWNYCICLNMKAMLLLNKGSEIKAAWKFAGAFEFSRMAVLTIYQSRNDWLLNQISDCHALIRLGEMSLKAAAKILNPIPPESRMANISYSGMIDCSPIFMRIQKSRSKFNSAFFNEISVALNERR